LRDTSFLFSLLPFARHFLPFLPSLF
jgi:hypothetical protein